MDRQAQLLQLQGLMESQRRIEEVTSQNDALRRSLVGRSDTINRLHQLTIATATLLTSVDSSSPQTEPSSLQLLTKLPASTAVTPDPDDAEPDLAKAITGKFLSQLLTLVVQVTRDKKGDLGFQLIVQLEEQINALLRMAEQKQLIPRTDEKAGWKKKISEHQPIYDRMAEITKPSDDEEEEPE
jgi:hypothetical protein